MNQNHEFHERGFGMATGYQESFDLKAPAHRVHEPREQEFKNSLRRKMSDQRSRSHSPSGLPRFNAIRTKPAPHPTSLPFNDPPFKSLKFGNIADCREYLCTPLRFTPQSGIHWQLNLRSTQRDVDRFRHSLSRQSSYINPHSEAPPYDSSRSPGCEGSLVSMWKHLYKPGVTRANLAWETTLRGLSDKRIDNSSFHRRSFSLAPDSIIQSDPKLNYIYSHY
jgi:hypothetical protein